MRYRTLFLASLVTLFSLCPSATALDSALTYQGYLEVSGTPADGLFDMDFRLFNDLVAGAQIGPTVSVLDVEVRAGYFSVDLDFGLASYTGDRRWLSVAVRSAGAGPFQTLEPRQELTPTPYSLHALDAEQLDGRAVADFMLRATYDSNGDGLVDAANTAISATTAGDADTVDGLDAQDLLGAATGNTELLLISFMNMDQSGNLPMPPARYVADFFSSDSATLQRNLVYDSAQDLYRTNDFSSPTLYLAVIEALDVDASELAINNCSVLQLSDSHWAVYSDFDDSLAKNRARVLYTLFNDVRVGARGVTGLFSLVSNDPADTSIYPTGLKYRTSLCCFTASVARRYDLSGASGSFEVLYRIDGSTNNNGQMAAFSRYESPLNVARQEVDDEPSGGGTVTVLGSEPDLLLDAANWPVVFRFGLSSSQNRSWTGNNAVVLLTDAQPTLAITDSGSGGTIDFLNTWENEVGIPINQGPQPAVLQSVLETVTIATNGNWQEVYLLAENETSGNASLGFEASLDDGQSWTAIGLGAWQSINVPGSDLKLRMTISRSAADESVSIKQYGVMLR